MVQVLPHDPWVMSSSPPLADEYYPIFFPPPVHPAVNEYLV